MLVCVREREHTRRDPAGCCRVSAGKSGRVWGLSSMHETISSIRGKDREIKKNRDREKDFEKSEHEH